MIAHVEVGFSVLLKICLSDRGKFPWSYTIKHCDMITTVAVDTKMPLRQLLSNDLFNGNDKTLIIVLIVVIVVLILVIGCSTIWFCGKKRSSKYYKYFLFLNYNCVSCFFLRIFFTGSRNHQNSFRDKSVFIQMYPKFLWVKIVRGELGSSCQTEYIFAVLVYVLTSCLT